MSHAMLDPPRQLGRTARAATPRATSQPRPTVADQLERLTSRFDQLTYRARLAPLSQRDYDALEEAAQLLASDLRAVFRGRSVPRNPPLLITEEGGLW
jgi:hypothetical protein